MEFYTDTDMDQFISQQLYKYIQNCEKEDFRGYPFLEKRKHSKLTNYNK